MASRRIYSVPDEDTSGLTTEVLARTRPFHEGLTERGLPSIGRPKAAVTKTPVNLRLDPEIVGHFKAGGPGWQTRINEVLSRHVKAAKRRAAR